MKWKTEIKTRYVNMTIGDRTEQVEQKYEERIPVPPRDWDNISTKAAVGLVGLLTAIAIVWSTISIGTMLGGGVGFFAALLFDVAWTVCLILEWKSRFDYAKRAFPRRLGWALLFVTMLFIGWHGLEQGDVPLAVVGASVSLFAKVLWLGVMKHIDRELDPEHQKWVNAVISKANAQLAVAQVLRQVAQAEDAAVAHKLAIEMSRNGTVNVDQITPLSDPTLDHTGDNTQPALPAEYGHSSITPQRHGLYTRRVPESQYEEGTVEYDHTLFADVNRIHEPVVYFLRNGDRVKIGTSTSLGKRVQGLSLRLSDLVRVEYGGRGYEQALHRQFEDYRIGNTEWFLLEGDLAEYVGLEYDDSTGRYGHTAVTPPARTAATPQPSAATPPAHTVEADEVTTLGYDRESAIAEIVRMIKAGKGPSYNEAERLFGRPKSTVVGWVKAARKEASAE